MKKKIIVLIGKDGSRWSFKDLTGLRNPKTNNTKSLNVLAQAALETDNNLDRFEIIEVEDKREKSKNNT